MALKDTLANLQHQEEEKVQGQKDKPKLISEWQKEVADLFEEIQAYLVEYKNDGTMSFSEADVQRSEEMLGTYSIKEMRIVAGPVTIMATPVARMIFGARGRVDLYRQGYVAEQDRLLILRGQKSQTDPTPQWLITLPPNIGTPIAGSAKGPRMGRAAGPQDRQRVSLSKETLEQCLDFLLRK